MPPLFVGGGPGEAPPPEQSFRALQRSPIYARLSSVKGATLSD
jgi:hypothetical protein